MAPLETILFAQRVATVRLTISATMLQPLATTRARWCRQHTQSAPGFVGYQQGTPADFAEQGVGSGQYGGGGKCAPYAP
jgi:hypothetical protein